MFTRFFHDLKDAGVPVSLREYLTLLEAMKAGLPGMEVENFYYLSRTALVKDERHLDKFDRIFGETFKGLESLAGIAPEARELPDEWLRALTEKYLTPEEMAEIEKLGGWDELMKTLAERLKEQKERHEGGNKWIGTGGTSPFGHSGYHPEGVRIGGESRHKRAVKVWEKREFRNLQDDIEIGTRNIKVALRKLRKFAREGVPDEFDLGGTINSTARSGYLDVKMRPERRNTIKVLLFFDIGGSMDPYIRVCEELFSAAKTEFKHLEYYYFHNFLYDFVWKDNSRRWTDKLSTHEVLRTYGDDYIVIFVGDASMSPYEITMPGGSVEYMNQETGAIWMDRLTSKFGRMAWLNPVTEARWGYTPSIAMTNELLEGRMYPLTLSGLDRAIAALRRQARGENPVTLRQDKRNPKKSPLIRILIQSFRVGGHSMSNKRKVALIGAGFIAPVHLTALQSIRKVRVSAIVDPNMARAEGLARQASATAYPSIEAMLEADRPDAAHVVTPPPLHEATTLPLLAAGVPILLEKPMAQDAEECTRLIAAAEEGGTSLAINHNFIHHPAFVRARKMLESGRYGCLRRVQMRYAAPLRQMTARAFGHWMFNSPRNLLLEQAVHPLSQLDVLIGEVSDVQVQPGPVRRPADGIELVTDYAISLQGARGDAQLQIVLGANFPSWTMSLLCDDGVIDADIFESRVTAQRPHASIPPIDFAKRSFGVSRRAASAGLGGLSGFAREILRLGPLSDGFNRSIRGSIEHFHDRLFFDEPFIDLEGSRLVSLCEKMAQGITVRTPQAPAIPAADARYDVAVLGGTGFIGSRLVEELTARGQKVAVMARSLGNLPSIFHQENVGLFSGSISDEAKVREVIRRAPKVVNLAHGGGGATRDAIAEAMVGGARTVAAAASAEGAERLIFISSSAALYLGDPETTVTMSTPVDPEPDTRADYARAKILAEHAMEESDGVPIAILRPAIVVGPGASPFHSALGAYENETHCQGWNKGKNPLPFVLVDDVVSAIIATLDADIETIEGKAFNLVGGVRWTARQYTEELAKATGRPLKFHSSRLFMLMASEWAKWIAKKVAGRKGLLTPSSRDFKSRGMVAPIGTAAEQSALGWSPCTDEAQFRAQAIQSHADDPA